VVSTEDAVLWGRPVAPISDLDDSLVSAYYKALAHGALALLSKKEARFWKQAFFNWSSFKDIAKKEKVDLNVVYMTIRRAAGKLKKAAYKELKRGSMVNTNKPKKALEGGLRQKQSDWVTSQGFAKNIREVGKTSTDDLFKQRMQSNNKEINEFLKKHPEAR
jgi:predicted DNA-binding protein YlxM (UPF0122 family)